MTALEDGAVQMGELYVIRNDRPDTQDRGAIVSLWLYDVAPTPAFGFIRLGAARMPLEEAREVLKKLRKRAPFEAYDVEPFDQDLLQGEPAAARGAFPEPSDVVVPDWPLVDAIVVDSIGADHPGVVVE